MIELMPVSCWATPRPMPTSRMRRSHLFVSAPQPDRDCSALSSSVRCLTSAISACGAVGGADRLENGAGPPASRPLATSQRGDSGIRSMPKNSAMAGSAATASMIAPDARVVAPDVADDRVDDERRELADDDHQLVAAGERAADLVGGELGEVDGDHGGGAADGQAEDDAADDHDLEVRGEHAGQGADEEQDGQQDDRLSAPPGVGEPAADDRADCGAEQQRAGDDALGEGVRPSSSAIGRSAPLITPVS